MSNNRENNKLCGNNNYWDNISSTYECCSIRKYGTCFSIEGDVVVIEKNRFLRYS
jgi:hypothetical protein